MARPNPWAAGRPKLREETREFVSTRDPEFKVEIRLREMDAVGESLMADRAARYWNTWKDKDLPLPGGEPVRITEDLCRSIALLQSLDVGPEAWDLEDWLGVMICHPETFAQIAEFAAELSGVSPEELPN